MHFRWYIAHLFYEAIALQKMMGASTTISFRPEKQDKENRLQFKDVIGAENAKQELEIIVNYLKDPSAYDAANAKLPRGILLHGPGWFLKRLVWMF